MKVRIEEVEKLLKEDDNLVFNYDYERNKGEFNPDSYCEVNDDYYLIVDENEEGKFAFFWLLNNVDMTEVYQKYLADDECKMIFIATKGFKPKECQDYEYGMCYSLKGKKTEVNGKIRKMEETDAQTILDFCKYLEQDDGYAKNEASSFRYLVEENEYTINGIFENDELCGLLYYREMNEKTIVLSELAVKQDKKRKGYGRELINSVLNLYSDKVHYYSLHCNNIKSQNLVESLGGKFVGIRNLLIKDETEDEED